MQHQQQPPATLVTKDLKDQPAPAPNPARKAITDQGDDPLFDPARLEILAKVFESQGVDVTAFRQAIAAGYKPDYGRELVDALNEFITTGAGPAPAPAPAPARRQMPGILKPNSRPAAQAQKEEADQWKKVAQALTTPPPWFKGPGAA